VRASADTITAAVLAEIVAATLAVTRCVSALPTRRACGADV
jgi:hypothetical protein